MNFFDKNGEPLEWLEWARLLESDYRLVRQDVLANDRWISTIWLGFVQPFEPGLFETAVFDQKSAPRQLLHCKRSGDLAEAVATHEELMMEWGPPQ